MGVRVKRRLSMGYQPLHTLPNPTPSAKTTFYDRKRREIVGEDGGRNQTW